MGRSITRLFAIAAALNAALLCFGNDETLRISELIDRFNADDEELYSQYIPNSRAKDFIIDEVPRFECPDKLLEDVYYFRWWTYRKHIRKTTDGFVITEFLPDVPWAGKHNMISCAAAMHIREGRWLKNAKYVSDYLRIWLSDDPAINPRKYSFWAADSALELYKTRGCLDTLKAIYPKLKKNFSSWEKEHGIESSGLFWQSDNADGMECSISGRMSKGARGIRATINSYMYGEADALSKIARILSSNTESTFYKNRAEGIKLAINKTLWDETARFYKVIPLGENGGRFSPVRELHGYTPWYFSIPPSDRCDAWRQIKTYDGFKAPYGLTTAERRNPSFAIKYSGHECLWDGPVWPYATTITLTALANLLNDYPHQEEISKTDYFDALKTYAASHFRIRQDGKKIFWIDENINPFTGDWISRTRLKNWNGTAWPKSKGGRERGKDYNHSEFCNLIITGLVGVRPSCKNSIAVNPLAPDSWKYFKLSRLPYKDKNIDIIYDKDGSKYKIGRGLFIFVNGVLKASAQKLEKLEVNL